MNITYEGLVEELEEAGVQVGPPASGIGRGCDPSSCSTPLICGRMPSGREVTFHACGVRRAWTMEIHPMPSEGEEGYCRRYITPDRKDLAMVVLSLKEAEQPEEPR